MDRFLATALFAGFFFLNQGATAQQPVPGEIIQNETIILEAPGQQDIGPTVTGQTDQYYYRSQRTHYRSRPARRWFHHERTRTPAPRYDSSWDANVPYPKYYGAFHSSHFSNLGVPTGDIGFRGNSIYWSPW